MKIAVAGAGIIGACTAWAAAKQGHAVTLFEQDTVMAHTSQSSSKLLHGGLRYLETGQFALVKKALLARR
ncbi:FAD-dependent oxidoreductase, partial [Neisseria dentiae]|uniref:FAD-dependent oxidoreductase n=2 Tax=Neisseria TaxID=482 RepID=UPI00359F1345